MTRPIQTHLDIDALRHNLAVIHNRAPTSKLMAVVKANAYGHHVPAVFSALDAADALAVASLDEALQCRQLGWNKPVLLLEGVFEPQELEECAARQIGMVIHHQQQIDWLCLQPVRVPLFVKLNSGMNRLGFQPDAYHRAIATLRAHPQLSDITQISHFANADLHSGMEETVHWIDQHFSRHAYPVSLANSAAIFRHPTTHRDWIRPGIALYGASPFADVSAATLDLRPVMRVTSRIIAIQQLAAGEAVGYGNLWTAKQPTRVGIVACGYADGYPRHAPNGTPVLVENQRTHTLGRVSMDMLCVNLDFLPHATVGSPVTLWGDDLSVDEVARSAGTIGYELLCARAPRPSHILLDNSTS